MQPIEYQKVNDFLTRRAPPDGLLREKRALTTNNTYNPENDIHLSSSGSMGPANALSGLGLGTGSVPRRSKRDSYSDLGRAGQATFSQPQTYSPFDLSQESNPSGERPVPQKARQAYLDYSSPNFLTPPLTVSSSQWTPRFPNTPATPYPQDLDHTALGLKTTSLGYLQLNQYSPLGNGFSPIIIPSDEFINAHKQFLHEHVTNKAISSNKQPLQTTGRHQHLANANYGGTLRPHHLNIPLITVLLSPKLPTTIPTQLLSITLSPAIAAISLIKNQNQFLSPD